MMTTPDWYVWVRIIATGERVKLIGRDENERAFILTDRGFTRWLEWSEIERP